MKKYLGIKVNTDSLGKMEIYPGSPEIDMPIIDIPLSTSDQFMLGVEDLLQKGEEPPFTLSQVSPYCYATRLQDLNMTAWRLADKGLIKVVKEGKLLIYPAESPVESSPIPKHWAMFQRKRTY